MRSLSGDRPRSKLLLFRATAVMTVAFGLLSIAVPTLACETYVVGELTQTG